MYCDASPSRFDKRDLIVVLRLVGIDLNRRIIADAAQFRILLPQIALDQLGSGQELENCDVALRKAGGCRGLLSQSTQAMTQKSHTYGCSTCGKGSLFDK